MTSAENTPEINRRLDTWKEIGAFFGRDERTVKRWEITRGLPVHRVPGAGRANVYANTSELTEWLKGKSNSAGGELNLDNVPVSEAGAEVFPDPIALDEAGADFHGERSADAGAFPAEERRLTDRR
ncbi:MAG TPA: hypothetical protein VGD60_01200, partial [Candidatus Acidoferrales bacterium]